MFHKIYIYAAVFACFLSSCTGEKKGGAYPKYQPFAHSSVKGEGSYLGFARKIKKDKVHSILEIGSRDARDAIALSDFFHCHVWAFECNPGAIDLCKQNIGNNPNVTLVPYAVWKETGTIPFYAVSEHNIGASSCFPFNTDAKNYPDIVAEGLVQQKIEVPAIRLDKFLDENRLESVDLLCMDVQGAAYEVLQSLGSYLSKVRYIIVELEMHSIYEGEILYQDVDRFLNEQGFKRASASLKEDQLFGDVLYINSRQI